MCSGAATIPRHVTVQHIKGIVNTLADSVSRLKAVGLYHDLNFQNIQPELGRPFEPLPSVKQATHTPIEIHKHFIKPNIETLAQNYTAAQIDQPKLSIENASPKDVLCLEQKLMSLPKLTPEKNNPATKEWYSAIMLSITCTATHMKITSKMPWASYTKKSLTSTVCSHL